MTRDEAFEESIRLYPLIKDWLSPSPWDWAVGRRYNELLGYSLGQTDRHPDPDWTLESVAHLKGSPEGGTDPGPEEE